VNINTLADIPGFPVLIDGHHTVNDPKKFFVGGVVNQRTALVIRRGTVIGGFGSVCDFFNYTGMLVGVNKQSGGGVTQIYATEGGPGARPESDDLLHGNGGQAGIWMGGMAPATDDASRIFFTTGKNPDLFF
jgi:iron transport multicopper oxidase